MARKISMQQIADKLGVSKYTVSQALAGKPGVSEATRREVAALASALGYELRATETAHTMQRRLAEKPLEKEQPTGQGLIPDRDESTLSIQEEARLVFIGLDERHAKEPNFWKRVVEGLEAGCRMHGLTPRFFTFGQDSLVLEELPGLLGVSSEEARRACGFIIAGNCPLGTLLLLARLGPPMVLADHEAPLTGADAVLNANADAGRMACRHLLTQACGSLVFVGRDSFAVSFRERWWGCRLALDEAKEAAARAMTSTAADGTHASGGTPPNEDPSAAMPMLKKWTVPYGAPSLKSWQTALERRLSAAAADGSLPNGFICANDDIALYLLQLLEAKGLQGIRVAGIDNTAPGMQASLPLTTVDLAKEWLGIRAVEAFVRKLKQPEAQPEKIVLSARLVVRSSG